MLVQSTGPGVLTAAVLLLFISACCCQFPAVCNTPANLASKTCCPNNCGGPTNGRCQNVLQDVSDMWSNANPIITELLHNAPNHDDKLAADSRYKWPTVVFENVCICSGNYSGVDCMDCDYGYGWTGSTCSQRKTPVIRKSFSMLSDQEKEMFMQAYLYLKNEMGVWAVIATEPRDYTTGNVILENVSTYDFYIFMHSYVARDRTCKNESGGHRVDFAHGGPSFPVWHRHFLLLLEKDFQRVMGNDSFGFPYWQWEENDMSPFDDRYLGEYSWNGLSNSLVNVSGVVINPATWNTVCDGGYIYLQKHGMEQSCSKGWKLCNPVVDHMTSTPLQRGYYNDVNGFSSVMIYVPDVVEVKIAIAAEMYHHPGDLRNFTSESFNRRLEGWDLIRQSFSRRLEGSNVIRSAEMCSGGPEKGKQFRMHNLVHVWVGGHMSYVPAAVNDPIFSLHHSNIDRIMESWMNKFGTLRAYEPTSGGHPGHNRDDYLVPFFPLVTAVNRYRRAQELGYMYDSLITSVNKDKVCTSYGVTLKLGLWFGLGLPLLITVAIIVG